MNNTVKYTIIAAVIIIAAAFGIQTFVGKPNVPGSDLSAMAPAAGESVAEPGETITLSPEEAAAATAASEAAGAVPPAPTPDQPAAPGGVTVTAPDGTTIIAPNAQEPAAGAPVVVEPANPENVPSFEEDKPNHEPVEN